MPGTDGNDLIDSDPVLKNVVFNLSRDNPDLGAQLRLFANRCMADVNFRKNAVAAALLDEELKPAFLAEVNKLGYQTPDGLPAYKMPAGYSATKADGTIRFSYNSGHSAISQLTMSAKPSPGPAPAGQLSLLSYNGSEWNGLLAKAAPIVILFSPGGLTMALLQTLLGSRSGMILLPALLALLL